MAMSRRAWIVVVMIVLAAGASGAWFYAQSRGSTPKFRTAKVERGPLTATVSATGTLNAVVTVQVGSQVSGQIKELFADFNSQVKRNQLVARIDPEKSQPAVSQAKAQVEKTRADLANAQAALAVAKAQTAKAQVDHGDLGLGGLRLGHGEGRLGIGEVGSGLLDQGPLVEHGRLGRVHLGLGLGHRGLELLGVDPGHELVALDLGVEVREELLDLPRDLGADLDGDDGVERARGRDGGGERPPLDLGRAEAGRAAAALRVEPRAAGARGQHDHHDHDPRTTTHTHETTLRGALFLEAEGAPEGSGALR